MSSPIDLATIVKRVELLEQSIATILPIVSKLLAGGAVAAPTKPSVAAAPATKKKAKKERAPPDPDAPKRELPEGVKAWNAFVTQTIEDMKQKGWEAFTDLSGTAWAASKPAEDGGGSASAHVFADTGDAPSRVKGGLVYASLLRSRDDPEAAARAKARRETRDAQIAAKSTGGSEAASASGDAAAGGGEKPPSKRAQAAKERWAAMSEEERAERKAKMAAGRAAAKAPAVAEE
jgi:hypothetical protein